MNSVNQITEGKSMEISLDQENKAISLVQCSEESSNETSELIELAIDQHSSDDICIDSDAQVSVGEDGVWVQAWVLVKS